MSEDLFDLNAKLALVTGSYRELGSAIARGLAQAGAAIAVNSRNKTKAAEAVAAFEHAGLRAIGCPFDVTNFRLIERAVKDLEKQTGPVDVLFNNARIIHRTPLVEETEESWRELIDTDVAGSFLVARATVRSMIHRGHGKTINTCSLLSKLERDTVAAYSAAKAGLKMLTQSMATEWGRHNIQTNAIGPGYFSTELTRPLQEDVEFDSWLKKRVPAGRGEATLWS